MAQTLPVHIAKRSGPPRSFSKLFGMDSTGGTIPSSQEWSKSSIFMGETSPAWTRDMASFARSQSRIEKEDDALPRHKSNYWTPDRGLGASHVSNSIQSLCLLWQRHVLPWQLSPCKDMPVIKSSYAIEGRLVFHCRLLQA